MNIINLLKRSKKNKLLLSKFNQLEKDLSSESELVSAEKKEILKQESHVFEGEKTQSISSPVFEEEVFWWESLNRNNETSFGEKPMGNPEAILHVFKKTELYSKISGLSDMEMNYYDDGKRNVITVMWNNSYLNLSDRRTYLKLIEDVYGDFAKNGIKCSLIHDNKRLAISNNIGVKLVSIQEFEAVVDENTNKIGVQI